MTMFTSNDMIGKYRIIRMLQRGCSSVVYLLMDSHKKLFAGKVINRDEMEKNEMTQNIEQEIRIHSMLHHPNIVELHDVIYLKNYIVIITDYYETDLYTYLNNYADPNYVIASRVFTQLMDVLQYLEKLGLAHCDIKPENILVDKSMTIKLCDFGSCESINMPRTMQSGSIPYIPPEVAKGTVKDFRKWDVWSAAIVSYYALTGKLPWESTTQEDLIKEIIKKDVTLPSTLMSQNFYHAMQECLSKDPAKRPYASEVVKSPLFEKTTGINVCSSLPHAYSSKNYIKKHPLIVKPKSAIYIGSHSHSII